MDYRSIDDSYAVSGQITADEVAEIKAAGFRSVICNRPDGEQPGQPTAADIGMAVEAAGLAFRHIPVVSGQITARPTWRRPPRIGRARRPGIRLLPFRRSCTNLYMMATGRG